MWNCTTAVNDKLCRQLRSCMRSKEENYTALVRACWRGVLHVYVTSHTRARIISSMLYGSSVTYRRHIALEEFQRYDRCSLKIYVSFAMTFFLWNISLVYTQIMLFISRRNRVSWEKRRIQSGIVLKKNDNYSYLIHISCNKWDVIAEWILKVDVLHVACLMIFFSWEAIDYR